MTDHNSNTTHEPSHMTVNFLSNLTGRLAQIHRERRLKKYELWKQVYEPHLWFMYTLFSQRISKEMNKVDLPPEHFYRCIYLSSSGQIDPVSWQTFHQHVWNNLYNTKEKEKEDFEPSSTST